MVKSISPAQSANDAYHSIIAFRQEAYNKSLSSAQLEPFVYPWDTFSAALLFLALLFIPRLPQRHRTLISISVFTWIVYFCVQTMLKARCLSFANGYGIGLMCSWGIIMSIALLFCNDIGKDLQRIEWREVEAEVEEHLSGSAIDSAIGAEMSSEPTPTRRKVWGVDGPPVSVSGNEKEKPSERPYRLHWQGYPSSILHCMEWCADLMTTFRGVGWNWRIRTCPPLDIPMKESESKLKPRNTATTTAAKSTSISPQSIRQLQLTGLRDFICHYLVLDVLKTMMISDSYFLGAAPLSSPSPWPFLASKSSTSLNFLTRIIRLTVSVTGVLSALTFIFSLSPLFFVTLLPITQLHHLTSSPLLEPALYPPYWAPIATISTHGLAGLWGKWWHQLFRFGVSEPSRALIDCLRLGRKSALARALQLGIAFSLSGFVHACASFTTFAPSRPLSGPFTFFVLQAIGITLQQYLTVFCRNNLYFAYRVDWLSRATNVGFVLVWMCLTGPLIADDFARCGLWLFEPVPFSLCRGLIWGEWWAWTGVNDWFGWHAGNVWYKSGVAFY